jgi:hypothetical protein
LQPKSLAILAAMAQFRAKKLDLGCFINSKIIRDHTKRKTFEQFEPQRYDTYIAHACFRIPRVRTEC